VRGRREKAEETRDKDRQDRCGCKKLTIGGRKPWRGTKLIVGCDCGEMEPYSHVVNGVLWALGQGDSDSVLIQMPRYGNAEYDGWKKQQPSGEWLHRSNA